jgi:hypothetical protein
MSRERAALACQLSLFEVETSKQLVRCILGRQRTVSTLQLEHRVESIGEPINTAKSAIGEQRAAIQLRPFNGSSLQPEMHLRFPAGPLDELSGGNETAERSIIARRFRHAGLGRMAMSDRRIVGKSRKQATPLAY